MSSSSLPFPAFLVFVGLVLSGSPAGEGTLDGSHEWRLKPHVGAVSRAGSDPDPEIVQLQRELENILMSTGNRRGEWGVLAVSLDRHDTLLAMNPARPMIPASNMKLLTTAAAFHYLGPEFRYRTFLLADGPSRGPVIEGDLIFYGTGDPTLSERYFPTETAALDSLAVQLARMGISEIRGDLVVDGSYFQGPELHPEWDPADLNDAFAAPVAAVSLAENVVTVRVEPGAWIGARPSIFTIPAEAGVPVLNLAVTQAAGSYSRVWLLRDSPRDPIGIEGEIPLNGSDVWRRLPVGDPLEFAGVQLRHALERQGITVSGEVATVQDPEVSRISGGTSPSIQTGPGGSPRVLAALQSPPLKEILRVINKESHNFFAEMVLRTLGRTTSGDGSFAGGAAAVERFLTSVVGVDPFQVHVRDGSGLSMENRATPGVFVRTLEHMADSPDWETFLETLPEAGVRQDLRRMYNSPAARNLRAKTGTMDSVSALSGLVRTRTGERILFSILSNDVPSEYRAKRAEDQVGIRLASLTRPTSN